MKIEYKCAHAKPNTENQAGYAVVGDVGPAVVRTFSNRTTRDRSATFSLDA